MLAFQLDHARAIDAVHAAMDIPRIQAQLGRPSLVVDSAAGDRIRYLQNPALGRCLDPDGPPLPKGVHDLSIIIADGLSATAVHAHAAPVAIALSAALSDWSQAPVVLARQARVAIGDPVGVALGARCTVVLVGERPGLSAADSLSAYLTWAPRIGRRDSERNCVSNIRAPGGLDPQEAAEKIAWLLREARRLNLSGVALKDRHVAAPSLPNPDRVRLTPPSP
jgi:ethanolamine ammonia-lyase small subunit